MLEITRDLKDILICALRYALGRRTYITSLVANYIMEHKELIDERIKNIMLKDIIEYESKRNYWYADDECDYQNWLKLKKWLEELDNENNK